MIKIQKLMKKRGLKTHFLIKMGGKTRFHNHVIIFFKYQYVKELQYIREGLGGRGEGFDSPIYIYYNLFK